MTTRITHVTDTQLRRQKAEILAAVHLTYEQLLERHAYRDLNSDEWDAWDRIRNIDFLLGDY